MTISPPYYDCLLNQQEQHEYVQDRVTPLIMIFLGKYLEEKVSGIIVLDQSPWGQVLFFSIGKEFYFISSFIDI